MFQGKKEMTDIHNFLYLYQKWTQSVFAKAILLSFMVIITTIIMVIVIADDSEEDRARLETTISLLVNIMMFVAGIGLGVLVVVPMVMNRLQDKL